MKQELIKNITPLIEKFADDVLSSFNGLEQIRKNAIQQERKYQDLCEEREKELKQIKDLKANEKRISDQRITDLENAKSDFVLKAKSYEDLTNDLKAKKKDIENNLAKSEIELIRAKEVRGCADDKMDKASKVKSEYELKLQSLSTDTSKIVVEFEKIRDEKKKLTARENDIFKNETKNNEKAQELNSLDQKIKAERAEVNRLIKLYKLKEIPCEI